MSKNLIKNRTMNKLLLPLCMSGLMMTNAAMAEDDYYHSYEHTDVAKVVNVEPLYETISYSEPQRECHYEQHVVRHHSGSKTPIIIGSLIGGAIGNELGHNKSNKKVGAVAGAILGGSIASDLNRKDRGYHTKRERVCTTTERVRYKEELTGYNVTYKYRGKQFHTTMDRHPGERIRVAVSVRPLDS